MGRYACEDENFLILSFFLEFLNMKRCSSEPDLNVDGHYCKRYPVIVWDKRPDTEIIYRKPIAELMTDTYSIPLACFYDAESLLQGIVKERNPEVDYVQFLLFRERRKCLRFMNLGIVPQLYLARLRDYAENRYFSPDRSLNKLLKQLYEETKRVMEQRINEILSLSEPTFLEQAENRLKEKILGKKCDFTFEYEDLEDQETSESDVSIESE